jgi:PBP1b-binding outer membrane lipoprotein LpoB
MNKFVITFVAAAAALVLSGLAAAVDTHRSQQDDPGQSQEPTQQEQVPVTQNGATDLQAAPNADATSINPEYAAALKRCEAMTGARKTACADAARTKFGQM